MGNAAGQPVLRVKQVRRRKQSKRERSNWHPSPHCWPKALLEVRRRLRPKVIVLRYGLRHQCISQGRAGVYLLY
jgi:hypothetical protein